MSRQPGSATLERFRVNESSFKKNGYHNLNKQNSIERTNKSKHKVKTSDDVVLNNVTEVFKRLDNYEGFFSTQQIESVDYEKFENHVFFDSAVNKVHYAFTKILNEFPYDGTSYDLNQYIRSLDGFTKYIYDNKILKNLGYLKFDGTNEVYVKDNTGNILDDFRGDKKIGLIDLNKLKFSFDFWLHVNNSDTFDPAETQIIFQKKNLNDGITIYLDNFSSDDDSCDINILLANGNNVHKCKSSISLGTFQHVNFSVIVLKGKRYVSFYLNGEKTKATNSGAFTGSSKFNEAFIKAPFYIGNGVSHTYTRDNSYNVTKTSGLKGIIDEFRFFTGNRKSSEVFSEMKNQIFARKNLGVYFKFNEPNEEYTNNHIVLDYSGNRVHGLIRNNSNPATSYTTQQISVFRTKDPSISTPIVYEEEKLAPVLFPNYGSVISDQQSLLQKAEEYDKINPNAFYKLFPKYLFVENADFDGLDDIFASKESIELEQNEVELLGVTQPTNSTLFNILAIWSRFFDQLKVYIDHVTKTLDIDYDNLDSNNSSVILPIALSQIGIDFKEIFPSTLIEKLNNKNLTNEEVFSQKSIRQIQNNLWKRFLINSQDFIRSKGTLNSIKSVFNSFGLEADTFVKIREFNSQNSHSVYESFTRKVENIKFIDFTENAFLNPIITYTDGRPDNRILLETGLVGNDRILSSDWAVECFYKFDPTKKEDAALEESILRIDNEADSNDIKPYINLVFKRSKESDTKGTLLLYVNETNNNNEIKVTELNDVNMFSNKLMYVCINKKKKTDTFSVYDLNISESDIGSKGKSIQKATCIVNIQNKVVSLDNCQLRIGTSDFYTNATKTSLTNASFETNFSGQVACVRLWKTNLQEKDILVHKTDFTNFGLSSDDISSMHDNLIANVYLKQKLTQDLSGNITNNYFTFSNDVLNPSITSTLKLFVPDTLVNYKFIKSIDYIVLKQSQNIDYPENYNRVNIASLDDSDLAKDFRNTRENPTFRFEDTYVDHEDIRLTIDFSVANFINKEISNIILVNDYFTQALSNMSSLYEESYQSLLDLQKSFYERLEKQISSKQLYQVYKYFDNILEEILVSAVSSKVHYHGFNFVFESHIAERHKYAYKMSDSRLGLKDTNMNYNFYDTRISDASYWNETQIRTSTFSGLDNTFVAGESIKRYSRSGSWKL